MKSVAYNSATKLNCGCNAAVIICLDSDLTASGYPFIEATLVFSDMGTNACGVTTYIYAVTYDEGQLADPNYSLVTADITGVICRGCLTTYIDSLFAGISETDWHILGNSGTVDGTNFCGTIDNVAFDVRVNNQRSRRTVPNYRYLVEDWASNDILFESAPHLIDGSKYNSITSGETGSAILSGGYWYPYTAKPADHFQKNEITSFTGVPITSASMCNLVCGGNANRIVSDDEEGTSSSNVITGGVDNSISTEDYPGDPDDGTYNIHENFVGGGWTNGCFGNGSDSVVVGGNYNWVMAYINHTPNPDELGAIHFADFIGGGGANQIEGGEASSVVGGYGNYVLYSNTSVIGGGDGNKIGTLSGYVDPIYDANSYNAFIGGGAKGFIEKTDCCSIVGGSYNEITSAAVAVSGNRRDSCTIIGGVHNKIKSDYSGAIFGGASVLGGVGLYLTGRSVGVQLGVSPPTGLPFVHPTYTDLTAFYDIFYCGDADLWIGNVNNAAKKIKFFEPNTSKTYTGTHYSSIEAQTQAANIEYKLPAAAGVAGQVLKIQSVVGTVVTLEWANDLT